MPALIQYQAALYFRIGHHPQRIGRSGFTVMEVVAAVVIVGLIAAMALPKLQENIDRARVARAMGDIRAFQADIEGWSSTHEGQIPPSLASVGRASAEDPWGNPYVYRPFDPQAGLGSARKDRFLVPLNSTFDLYSKGKDGESVAPLNADVSQDDVIRANDGGFIGLAKNY